MADHQDDKTDFEDLDALFAEARDAATPELPEALMSAILADAAAEQSSWQTVAVTARPDRRGPLALLVMALGGWGSVGGLVAASCTGLWIGIADPEAAQWAPGFTLTAANSTTFSSAAYAAYETFDLATVLAEDLQ
ncbi:hypothetical protein [Phaeobacter sp. HF9A]|uniref:hypothetical protein n=1 Tax=Phaeobacter sp. HF9A TaxID=2721561 RepID=UPI00142F9A68|nr:hypothetical protein [Phaeobacter sp. HF9A]NIZ14706.1 hypothetical protein [Phaeobacter sp. HF9A]